MENEGGEQTEQVSVNPQLAEIHELLKAYMRDRIQKDEEADALLKQGNEELNQFRIDILQQVESLSGEVANMTTAYDSIETYQEVDPEQVARMETDASISRMADLSVIVVICVIVPVWLGKKLFIDSWMRLI